jgi:Putative porin
VHAERPGGAFPERQPALRGADEGHRVTAFFLLLLAAGFASGQEAEFFQPPPQKPKVVFRWDALARYDVIDHLHVRPDIERGRFEVRPEVDLELSDRFKIGVRAIGDLGTDHNEDNAKNFDNYRSRGATIERYYVEAKPGQFALRAGAFGMPLVASEMLWDRDIQTPGVAAAWEVPAGASSSFTIAGAGFYGPQREGDQTRIGVGQLVFRSGDPAKLAIEAAGSYWHFNPDDLKPVYFRQNYTVVSGGQRELVSKFHIVDAFVRLRFPVGGLPVSVGLDGIVNLGVRGEAAHEKSAFEGVVSVGRLGNPWDWRVFYIFQYVERDAVLGAYNTDDWWFHSWHRGSRIGAGVTILPQVFIQATAVFQKRLDLRTTLNRVIVDLVKMF